MSNVAGVEGILNLIDGPLSIARFNDQNRIKVIGDTMYIADSTSNRIRIITGAHFYLHAGTRLLVLRFWICMDA